MDMSKELHQFVNPEKVKFDGKKERRGKPLVRVGQDQTMVHKNQLGWKP
jgi:hypothetical protein